MTSTDLDAQFLGQLTVLLVEDDLAARIPLATALRRRVGQVLTADEGAKGLALFQTERPHLVVTDIQMPGLDGLDMVQAIRALAPKVPVIILTAFEQTDYMARAIDLGINHYVIKPLRMDRLEECLLACAHGLWLEQELARKQELELELERLRHQEAVCFLLSGLAHDYNNLMQGTLASVSLAMAGLERGSAPWSTLAIGEQGLLEAQSLGKRLRTLINPHCRHDRQGPIDLLIRQAVMGAVAGTAIVPEFTFQIGALPVSYNEAQLEKAIASVARNAMEAMEAMGGLGTLRVRLQETAQAGPDHPPGRYLHLILEDDGPGIEPRILPLIFEPYFTTKQRSKQRGTGLSLAVCEAVIRAHGGWIFAESHGGNGAAIHVLLPVATMAAKDC